MSTPQISKFSSRKYRITQLSIGLSIAVAVGFHYIGIAEAVTLSVEALIASAGAFYGLSNTLSKKWGLGDD